MTISRQIHCGSNYFKLRDLAMALSGTEKQFNVGWSKESNAIVLNASQPYAAVDGGRTGQSCGILQKCLTSALTGTPGQIRSRSIPAAIIRNDRSAVPIETLSFFCYNLEK